MATIYGMWIPCVVFGHLFAAYFLMRMLLITHPTVWRDCGQLLTRRRRKSDDERASGTKGKVVCAFIGIADIDIRIIPRLAAIDEQSPLNLYLQRIQISRQPATVTVCLCAV